jgi:acyl-CoA synthetase (AMP-forming)/AMP-acid ligase II
VARPATPAATAEATTESYPGHWGVATPDKPAVIMVESGDVVTHADLDERSSRAARVLHDAGLRPGDHLALFSENNARYHEVVWGALRSGLILTPVNTHLNPAKAATSSTTATHSPSSSPLVSVTRHRN